MAVPANGAVLISRPRASSPTRWPTRGASTNLHPRLKGLSAVRSCPSNAGRSTLACSRRNQLQKVSGNLSNRSCSKAFLSARRTLRPSAARPLAVSLWTTASLRSGGSDLLCPLIAEMRRKLRKDHSHRVCKDPVKSKWRAYGKMLEKCEEYCPEGSTEWTTW